MSLEDLRTTIRGTVIAKGDRGYDDARKVYNAMISKKPALIVYCTDAADVMQAVNYARGNKLLTSVRGGGHNAGGLGICDDGLVVDLSRIRYVQVDPEAGTVRVGGGCTWGDVDHATHPFSLAVPTGIISTTGVGGLTLGGGMGHLTRKYGFTIDNLLEADVVLADGTFVKASTTENTDLFWAIRGGGGNFGIITSFLFKGNPVKDVIGGPTLWSMDKAGEVLKWYRNFILEAPRDLNGFFTFLTVPPAPPFPEHLHMQKMCGVVWCYTGPAEEADKVFEPVKNFASPELYGIQSMPFPGLQTAFDGLYPPGYQWYWRADFINEITDEAVAEHVRFGSKLPTMHSTMHMYPIDGAAHDRSNEDTPWSYRQSNWAQVIVGVHPTDEHNEEIISWAKNYHDAIHPHSAGGAYVNFMMHDEGQERVQATYKGNYEKLAAIKDKYDPENFFRVNQNIKPSK